jgi:hypothetical protein
MMMSHYGEGLVNPTRALEVNRCQYVKNDEFRSVKAVRSRPEGRKTLGFERLVAIQEGRYLHHAGRLAGDAANPRAVISVSQKFLRWRLGRTVKGVSQPEQGLTAGKDLQSWNKNQPWVFSSAFKLTK